jgi:hypothetical protein
MTHSQIEQQPAVAGTLEFDGYKIELTTNFKGQPVANAYKLMTTGKNKGRYTLQEGYRFENEERREKWVSEYVANVKRRLSEKNQELEAKKEIRANMQHDFKVGDIYYDSWGYEQTNINYYEIVEIKAKSVIIREIARQIVKGSGGHDSARVVPVLGNYTGERQIKPILFYVNEENKPVYYIKKGNHGRMIKYDEGAAGIYCSWGY